VGPRCRRHRVDRVRGGPSRTHSCRPVGLVLAIPNYVCHPDTRINERIIQERRTEGGNPYWVPPLVIVTNTNLSSKKVYENKRENGLEWFGVISHEMAISRSPGPKVASSNRASTSNKNKGLRVVDRIPFSCFAYHLPEGHNLGKSPSHPYTSRSRGFFRVYMKLNRYNTSPITRERIGTAYPGPTLTLAASLSRWVGGLYFSYSPSSSCGP
jgi:hypothetical protein